MKSNYERIDETRTRFEVTVTGDEVLLRYTIPLTARGLAEETLPVLSIGHSGGRYWT